LEQWREERLEEELRRKEELQRKNFHRPSTSKS
jgi:hypothetical protein